MKKKVVFWISDTDSILNGYRPKYGIGGANVQMALWANLMAERGYLVFALTRFSRNNRTVIQGINYIWHPVIRYFGFVFNYLIIIIILARLRPNIVFTRAKLRELYFINKLSGLFQFKLVHMLASDNDVIIDDKRGVTFFQHTLSKIEFVIAQNFNQRFHYQKSINNIDIPVIPNIWNRELFKVSNRIYKYDFVWVANILENKRPFWFINLAKELPQYNFALVGAPYNNDLFIKCQKEAQSILNIEILGYKSLFEVNEIISNSKVLVCTSVVEGFPNTFLQALNEKVPLLSTVDPNEIIKNYELGNVVSNEFDLKHAAIGIIDNQENYRNLQFNIARYFESNHSPEKNLLKIENYII